MGLTSTRSEAKILEIHGLEETSTMSEAEILGIHGLEETSTRSESKIRPAGQIWPAGRPAKLFLHFLFIPGAVVGVNRPLAEARAG